MNALSDEQRDWALSERERRVLSLLEDGMTARAIAAHLDIRVSTVQTYIRRIYQKLDVTNRSQAVRAAIDARLIGGKS